MLPEILRLILIAVLALLLAQQAWRAGQGTRRRQAFAAGALAFVLFALANLFTLFTIGGAWLTQLSVGLGLALVLVAVLALLAAYRRGEMASQLQRARSLLNEERQRYERREGDE